MTDFAYAPQTVILPNQRFSDALRYGGVLVVWLGLTAVRPRLGMQLLRQRRADSLLRRPNRQKSPANRPIGGAAGGFAVKAP